MTKPVLTAVNGLCCGAGLDLVTTGDITIASERAEFFDPHVSIGLVSGREMVRLARVLPAQRRHARSRSPVAHERMSAQRAYELGMVTEVVEHDRLLDRAREIAQLVNRNAPLAVRGTRLAIRKGIDLPLHEAEILAETFRERVGAHRRRRGRTARVHGEARPEVAGPMTEAYATIRYESSPDRVATITLDRPDVAQRLRSPDVRGGEGRLAPGSRPTPRSTPSCLRAAGDRAFCAGLDVKQSYGQPDDVWNHEDPGEAAEPEMAEGVEAGGVRGARDVHGRRVLLRQRGRRRDLLRGRDVLRLARDARVEQRQMGILLRNKPAHVATFLGVLLAGDRRRHQPVPR